MSDCPAVAGTVAAETSYIDKDKSKGGSRTRLWLALRAPQRPIKQRMHRLGPLTAEAVTTTPEVCGTSIAAITKHTRSRMQCNKQRLPTVGKHQR